MREIRTSGSMSGDGNRDDARVVTAPTLDSTENKGRLPLDSRLSTFDSRLDWLRADG